MGSVNPVKAESNTNNRESSPELLSRFAEPLDCLTAHLMLECSEVLAGVKPANLVSLVNRTRSCGRNLFQLWLDHYQLLSTRFKTIEFLVLQKKERSVLLLCFNKNQLSQNLKHAGIRTLLQKAGYDREASLDQLLSELQQRVSLSNQFPHEIGLFIGYPPKDVAAFMGLIKLPFTCQALWKIYGNPSKSLDLAEHYRCCRQRMSLILATGDQTMLKIHHPEHPFFYHTNDIKLQNPYGRLS